MFHRTRSTVLIALLALAALSLSACASTQGASGARQAAVKKAVDQASGEGSISLPAAESAYKRDSDDPRNILNYARALRENGRLQRASIILGPLIRNGQSDSADVLAEYGALQAAMGNYDNAEIYARKAIAKNSDNGPAWQVLGIALDAQGRHDQAETAFRSALEKWKGDPSSVLNNLGLNLAAQGFLDEAVDTLRKASTLSHGRTDIERNLRIVTALQAQSPTHAKPVPVPPPKPART